MKYFLTTPATQDLIEATEYYESVSPGGGARFLKRYEKAVRRVLTWPRSLPKYYWRTRICQIARSDYGIVFRVVRTNVYVLGVICLIRHPSYWKSRARDFDPEDLDDVE
ncbi:MAG: type II toxin-antitoxin system RelE/ParE family toxin [Gemmataceae bacterium]|nr:type II toxin-antitoxin system RelE/ParE family toxin [Gemmataceae bacterium]